MELREIVARTLYAELGHESDDPWDVALGRRDRLGMDVYTGNQQRCLDAADRILALPEIKEALAYMKAVDSAHPVFGEIREMLNKSE